MEFDTEAIIDFFKDVGWKSLAVLLWILCVFGGILGIVALIGMAFFPAGGVWYPSQLTAFFRLRGMGPVIVLLGVGAGRATEIGFDL